MEAGTVTAGLLLDNVTVIPADPALPDRLTVPVADDPPATDEGLTLTKASAGAVMVSVVVSDLPPNVAVIVDVV